MHKSVWIDELPLSPRFAALSGSLAVDTVVVGGGIAGLSIALALQEAGQRVAVVEAGRCGAGNTGNSTGNLYGTVSGGLATLRKKWNDDVVREVAAWRTQAIERIEASIATHGIECGFARRSLVRAVAGDDAKALKDLDQEFEASQIAGLSPRWLTKSEDLPIEVNRALQIDGQAQFNPYLYATGLARALQGLGVSIFEGSRVVHLDAGEGVVRTGSGEVRARHIVLATHTPPGFNLVQAEMEVYREYGVSATLNSGRAPECVLWVTDEGRSLRTDDDGRLVVVGEKHKTGEPEPGADYLQRLRDWAASRFDVDAHVHSWSAQQFKSADGLPYIGKSAHDNVLIATGFAADGLTWGAVAAAVIADIVAGNESDAISRLAPRRFTPLKSAGVWASENATVVKHLVGDRLTHADIDRLATVNPGDGAIVELDGKKHAVYRGDDGTLSVLSPVCPHLKCHVAWNAAETTWDCPCHGSRFRTDGSVIEGPALSPLENRLPMLEERS